MYLFQTDDIAVRRMRNVRDDRTLLLKWLTDQAVLAFVYGEDAPWNMEKIEDHVVEKTLENGSAAACIIEYGGKEIGYVQYYPIEKDSYRFHSSVSYEQFAGGFGMDMFIGEPELWGKGIGTKTAKAMAQYLFTVLGAAVVCADPESDNLRSIRCWEKAGFAPVGRIENYDDPNKSSVLMAFYRE